jgi:hypothetical protein
MTAANVTLGVIRAALTGDRGETGEHRSLLADLGDNLRFGVAANVVRDREGMRRVTPTKPTHGSRCRSCPA